MENLVFNKEMLILAREAEGHTQKELAGLLGCTQSKLSKIELGDLAPQNEDIQLFAEKLHQPVAFFSQVGPAKPSSVSFYRKTSTLPLKMLTRCNAQMNVRRLALEAKIGAHSLGSQKLPFLPINVFGNPKLVAQELRRLWGIPKGPIRNLFSLVENAGCVIVDYPFPSDKLDGLCLRADGKPPIVFLNDKFPKSRRRLSLAHELGHLVMHTDPHEDVEDEAWEFAAEFLMPSSEISKDFFPLTIDKLGKLKSVWGVSMQALLQHAKRLKKIGDSYYRFLWMQIGKYGYRINEPFEDAIPNEKPTPIEERLRTIT